MVLINNEMEKAVSNYYADYLTETPLVYPYMVDIIKIERTGDFRTFGFYIILETTPVVGPHISVGKDRLSFEIAPNVPGNIKLIDYIHLESHKLPPNWQHIIKQ